MLIVVFFTALGYQSGLHTGQDRMDERYRDHLDLALAQAEEWRAMTDLLQEKLDRRRVEMVTLTAYSPRVEECNEDPLTTASMLPVRPGSVAVSRDLFEKGWVFGRKVYIKGHGVYTITDLMNSRYTKRIDLFFWDTEEARQFGIKETHAALLDT